MLAKKETSDFMNHIFRFNYVLPEGHITGDLNKSDSLGGNHQLQNTRPEMQHEMPL